MKLYLQDIVEDISFENLPIKWQFFDFARFSNDKPLFDFKQNALKNALLGLWLYFKGNTPSLRDTPLQEGNYEVEFEDGTKIDTKDLDYKLIKPLIWWE
ncbi:MAG: hypothetical protein PWP68_188 [Rikenellaceae bacterium]|nr:hypothetical protein [Rikenellaceae bacterium]MDI3544771.1 hypothetical protein [Rikenellaceae bacterium]